MFYQILTTGHPAMEENEIMVSFSVITLFTSIDPELMKESMAAILHSTPSLQLKLYYPQTWTLSTSSSLPTFSLMVKYVNKSEEHP